ncbi:hypothetical protein ACFX19_041685 [Malus domestica]
MTLPVDRIMTSGLRIEILGALLPIQLIWLFSGILVYEGIVKTIDNTAETVNMLHNVHGVVMGSTPRETDVKRT